MNLAPAGQIGLALGAWGAVQATAAGLGAAIGGMVRDLVHLPAGFSLGGLQISADATGYAAVFAIEILLLLAALVAMLPLLLNRSRAEG
jgi:BCD family chlorophyll transporter-like MFS transporter